jgi:ribosomal protein S13
MSDKPDKVEPWFFELPPPMALGEDDQEKIDFLTAGARAIVKRMVDHVALDFNISADQITPQLADAAIDRVRDAIHAVRDKGPTAKATTDLEELAQRYMEAMRLYMRIYRAARARAG